MSTALVAALDLNTAIVVATAVIVGGFMLLRSRSDVWKSNFEAERARCERLASQLNETKVRIGQLEALPNLERLADKIDKLGEMIIAHDEREMRAWERITLLLDQQTAQLSAHSLILDPAKGAAP